MTKPCEESMRVARELVSGWTHEADGVDVNTKWVIMSLCDRIATAIDAAKQSALPEVTLLARIEARVRAVCKTPACRDCVELYERVMSDLAELRARQQQAGKKEE
jgi:hypothetical protein